MTHYILCSKFDLGVLKIWSKVRRFKFTVVDFEDAPFAVRFRILCSKYDTYKTSIVYVQDDKNYNRMKPFVHDI